MKFPAQTPTGGGVSYENLPEHPGGSAIEITETITGMTYKGTGCGAVGIPSSGDIFDYSGTFVVTGYEDVGGSIGAPIEGSRLPISIDELR